MAELDRAPELGWALELEAATRRLSGVIHPTPVRSHRELSDALGTCVVCKDEGAQITGSFKLRGACNALANLDQSAAAAGVITYSSGNFGKALAYAATRRATQCVVVASSTTPEEKLRGIEEHGAELALHDPLEDRAQLTSRLARARGLAFISPYDHPMVIAGQATAARELLRDVPNLDAVIVPVSGGGLLAGCALAADAAGGGTRVFGVESAAVPRMSVSLRTGRRESVTARPTIADALRVTRPGAVTFPIISSHVEAVVTVNDDELLAAMKLLWRLLGVRCEPSGAAGIAALLAHRVPAELGHVGVILSGSNIASARFEKLLRDNRQTEEAHAASCQQ